MDGNRETTTGRIAGGLCPAGSRVPSAWLVLLAVCWQPACGSTPAAGIQDGASGQDVDAAAEVSGGDSSAIAEGRTRSLDTDTAEADTETTWQDPGHAEPSGADVNIETVQGSPEGPDTDTADADIGTLVLDLGDADSFGVDQKDTADSIEVWDDGAAAEQWLPLPVDTGDTAPGLDAPAETVSVETLDSPSPQDVHGDVVEDHAALDVAALDQAWPLGPEVAASEAAPAADIAADSDSAEAWPVDDSIGDTADAPDDGAGQIEDGFSDADAVVGDPGPQADLDVKDLIDSGMVLPGPPTVVWAVSEGGANAWAAGGPVAAMPDGSVLVGGGMGCTLTFGPGTPGQKTFEIPLCADGGPCCSYAPFLARYSPSGVLSWVKELNPYPPALAALPDGSALAAGRGPCLFGPPPGQGGPACPLKWPNGWGPFLAKVGPDGSLLWQKNADQGQSTADNEAKDVAVAPDGSGLVAGSFHTWSPGTLVFGVGEPNETTLVAQKPAAGASSDVFVARYSPDGTLDWARSAGGTGKDEAKGIAVMPDGGAVVVGNFTGSATFGAGEPGETTLVKGANGKGGDFIARYGPDGSLVWAKYMGGSAGGVMSYPDGSALVRGSVSYMGNATFGQGEPNETVLNEPKSSFLARYSPAGDLLWAEADGGGSLQCLLPDGSFLLAGGLIEPKTFGPGEPGETTLAPAAAGGYIGFLVRYSGDGVLLQAAEIFASAKLMTLDGLSCFPDGGAVVTGKFKAPMTYGSDSQPLLTPTPGSCSYDMFVVRLAL